jgi:hypothetical protein
VTWSFVSLRRGTMERPVREAVCLQGQVTRQDILLGLQDLRELLELGKLLVRPNFGNRRRRPSGTRKPNWKESKEGQIL